jgi:hypothetical protein
MPGVTGRSRVSTVVRMSHAQKKLAERMALKKKRTNIIIGALGIFFGGLGLLFTLIDFRSGDLISGTNAATQQPYGPFLRLVCYTVLLGFSFFFIIKNLRGDEAHDEAQNDPPKP